MADRKSLRSGIAALSGDISNDAVGVHAPRIEEIYAPEAHASALDLNTPIVVGSRGVGKSFWAGVLGASETRAQAHLAYPRLGLDRAHVYFGYTGLSAETGVGKDAVDALVPEGSDEHMAKSFWWATVVRALSYEDGAPLNFKDAKRICSDWEDRVDFLRRIDDRLAKSKERILVVYDALDTIAVDWGRRRLLTEALLEVVWAMRAFRHIHVKIFVRPDQIDDDALRFVELPKLRTGAVRLTWTGIDLYGLLFARLATASVDDASKAFNKMCREVGVGTVSRQAILKRSWRLADDMDAQVELMNCLAGPFMASGQHGYKKGRTYSWPLAHLADAFDEVTPRSFLGLFIAAAKYGSVDPSLVLTPEGLRHGLRAASRTRVDQLHQEFPWIKGVLAPLAGLLLPQEERGVFSVWEKAKTIDAVREDAKRFNYLPPFSGGKADEAGLFAAMEKIGVMFKRRDDRIDMPDLFRVAAKLLKKGATAPL